MSLKNLPFITELQKPADITPVKLLVVDDSPRNIEAIIDTLQPLGETIVSADSGKAALKYLLDDEFAVILLDVNMPDINGFETAALIRKYKKSERTPIIFVTAFDEGEAEILKAYTLGAVDYIVKPYEADILRVKVQVFVDLFRLREEVVTQQAMEAQRQQEKEREQAREREKEAEIAELKQSLSIQQQLANWNQPGITEKLYGTDSLNEREASHFSELVARYATLIDDYLEAIAFSEKPPRQDTIRFAESLGNLLATPRDLIDIHLQVVAAKISNVAAKRARVYTFEGRLLALEAMGHLADYYRLRTRDVEKHTANNLSSSISNKKLSTEKN